MKSVLISIQPKWCELIARGKKTVEIRKTRPKTNLPFKVYIYCTKGKFADLGVIGGEMHQKRGKVIGEFVCDKIHNIKTEEDFESGASSWECGYYAEEDCLSMEELGAYLKKGYGYGWHISDLVIYDKPKELNEFFRYDDTYDNAFGWVFEGVEKSLPITRPPQSWCYVEGVRG